MTIIQSLILGLIQGLTEFIPVSSSGHLVLIPELFGWEVQSTAFDITVHAATLLALVIYFRKDLIKLAANLKEKNTQKLLINLVIITIPIGILGLLFEDFIDKHFKNVQIIAFMLVLLGILFVLSGKLLKKNLQDIDKLSAKHALIIGLCQALSLIRGTSRSGITTIGGLISGLSMQKAARFAFLAGIPIMIVVPLKQFVEFQTQGLGELDPLNLLIGFLSAFTSGFFAIKFMLKYLSQHGLAIFGIYRILIGLIIMVCLL